MKRNFFLILCYCLLASLAWAQTTKTTANSADIRKRLNQIYDMDQKERAKYNDIERQYGWGAKESQDARQQIKEMDKQNLAQVEDIIKQVGSYPGRTLVGQPLDQVAFLMIQHSTDPSIQEKYLPLVTEAAQKDELDKSGVAVLTDQIKVQKKEKQVYGTQIQVNNQGQKELYPVEDAGSLDQRRKDMNLEPIAAYLRRMGVKQP